MKKSIVLVMVIYFCIFTIQAEASTLENSFSFKCMVMSNGIEHEWEFSSPNEFEVESGKTVEKGDLAKQEVMKVFKHLEVSELSRVEDLVERMDSYGYDGIERFELKWMDASGRLYTWVWDEKDK
ncbi:MAG: hypothetical protein WBV93_04075 [Anaerobacillus sp.]